MKPYFSPPPLSLVVFHLTGRVLPIGRRLHRFFPCQCVSQEQDYFEGW